MHSFDLYRDTYQNEIERSISFIGQNHDFFIRMKANYLLSLFAKYVSSKQDSLVLDVGCGVGLIDTYLQEHVNCLHGVDVAEGVIDEAKLRNPKVTYTSYNGYHLPYDYGYFDFVFTVNVLHHVELQNRESFTRELKRVTKPDGIIAVFEHNPFNPLTQLAVSRCEFDREAVLLRKSNVCRMLKRVGVTLVEEAYIIHFPKESRLLDMLDKLLRHSRLGAQYYVAGINDLSFPQAVVYKEDKRA